ncbi:MAG TPA: cupin-like domain-containing protein, partial [Polyangium sp.]|nr:cupin-like domain-containing protein [Polyangium sp.]
MAARQWTFASLKARFGNIEIDVGDREPQRMRFGDALDAMSQSNAPPNLYIVSKNQVLRGPLAEMTRDLAPLPDFLHPEHAAPTANLWLGPANTLSPLHHDTTHVYFCQFLGRKRYRMIAPWHADVLRSHIRGRGDSDFDVDNPGDARVLQVVVEPGQALFIPAGFWHEVRSLEPSISVSFRAYPWDARFDWYNPASFELPNEI